MQSGHTDLDNFSLQTHLVSPILLKFLPFLKMSCTVGFGKNSLVYWSLVNHEGATGITVAGVLVALRPRQGAEHVLLDRQIDGLDVVFKASRIVNDFQLSLK